MRRMYLFAIAWLVAVVIIYFFGQANRVFLLFAANIISPAFAFLPALYSLTLVKRHGFDPKDRSAMVWWYAAAGLFLRLLGEITWAVYTLVLSVTIPYPSVADMFWISGALLLAFAIFRYLSPFKEALPLKTIVTAAAVALLADLGVFMILIGPILRIGAEPLMQVFALVYPVLDMGLLAMSVGGMLAFLPGRLSKSWLWFNLGLISIVIADLMFSYSTALGLYYDGHPLELLFYFGDLAILLGLYDYDMMLQGK